MKTFGLSILAASLAFALAMPAHAGETLDRVITISPAASSIWMVNAPVFHSLTLSSGPASGGISPSSPMRLSAPLPATNVSSPLPAVISSSPSKLMPLKKRVEAALAPAEPEGSETPAAVLENV